MLEVERTEMRKSFASIELDRLTAVKTRAKKPQKKSKKAKSGYGILIHEK
jgi:hypothetical protein